MANLNIFKTPNHRLNPLLPMAREGIQFPYIQNPRYGIGSDWPKILCLLISYFDIPANDQGKRLPLIFYSFLRKLSRLGTNYASDSNQKNHLAITFVDHAYTFSVPNLYDSSCGAGIYMPRGAILFLAGCVNLMSGYF